MPLRYEFLPQENVIYIECYGELTITEISEYFSEVAEDETIPKGAAEFVDLSRITYFNVDHKEAATMPANYTPAQTKKAITATILFGSTPINKGLSLLIEAYFNKFLPEHILRTVDTHDEAQQLLRTLRAQSGNSAREA